MGKNSFNTSVGKMQSLMERMGSNMTAYEAVLNEEMRIAEAVSSKDHFRT